MTDAAMLNGGLDVDELLAQVAIRDGEPLPPHAEIVRIVCREAAGIRDALEWIEAAALEPRRLDAVTLVRRAIDRLCSLEDSELIRLPDRLAWGVDAELALRSHGGATGQACGENCGRPLWLGEERCRICGGDAPEKEA